VRRRANFAKKTPIPWTKTEPPNAFHVRLVVLPSMEVLRAPIVGPGNTKKPRARVKRSVAVVRQAITRTLQTCQHASNAHLGMLNRLLEKRRALNAVLVNSTMLLVPSIVNYV
jgi:hypothetical protein